ncbi:MAG: RidA family protein [Verrucomicrobiales bacterium]|nr:RidA family protein [Verrucomicrobiales bacterium]
MKIINAEGAPKAIGPYSHAVAVDGIIFCSGQIPLNPATMEIVAGGIEAQTRQVLSNVSTVLAEAGARPTDVAKTTIFLTDMKDFPAVNQLYGDFFGDHKPARSTVAVAGLPMGALVEIECLVVTK